MSIHTTPHDGKSVIDFVIRVFLELIDDDRVEPNQRHRVEQFIEALNKPESWRNDVYFDLEINLSYEVHEPNHSDYFLSFMIRDMEFTIALCGMVNKGTAFSDIFFRPIWKANGPYQAETDYSFSDVKATIRRYMNRFETLD